MALNTKGPRCSSRLLSVKGLKPLFLFAICMSAILSPCDAQKTDSLKKYSEPYWWFGIAGGINFNEYTGSLSRAREVTNFPTPFRRGRGTGLFLGPLIEFRKPNAFFGLMLQQGIDDRSATYRMTDQELYTHLTYVTVEPSLRISPVKKVPSLYFYGGPRFAFLVTSDFTYWREGAADFPDRETNPDFKVYLSSVRKNPVSAQIGVGYDFKVYSGERTKVMISPFASYFPTMWRKNIRTIDRTYLQTLRAGVAIKVGRGRPLPPVIPATPIVLDRDGDGVLDKDDRCPDTFGLAFLKGCPDKDGDGIADIDDRCPDVFGFERYQGCPIPDRDKDGINDEEDKCPDVFGLARYQGCPIPDTDGDGVNDEEDRCKLEKGPASNYGCPIIPPDIIRRVKIAADNIFFETGKSKLLARSFPKLNDVVTILKENPSYNVQIDGHTDFVGNDESNQRLSEQRAAAVKTYFASQGVDDTRITSTGYGETRPIADNNTTAGKAKNRRVEMTVRNY